MIATLFDLPTIIFMSSSLMIGFLVGGSNLRKALHLARDISIPIGIAGALLGFTAMLANLDDPNVLWPATAVALLSFGYGVLEFVVLTSIVHRLPEPERTMTPKEQLSGQTITAMVLWMAFVIGIASLSSIANYVHVEAFLCVVGGAWLLSAMEGTNRKRRVEALGKYSLLIAVICAVFSAIAFLASLDDPSSLGPAIAMGFLSLLYGVIVYVLSVISFQSSYEEPFSFTQRGSFAFAAFSLCFAIAPFPIVLDMIQDWDRSDTIATLEKSAVEQSALLRTIAPMVVDPNATGWITVSTDTEALIFVNEILVSQSPLFQHELTPGTHRIQIASCPNPQIFAQTDGEITFQDYWAGASDGSCDDPSPEEMKELVASGQVREIVLSEEEGSQLMSYEFIDPTLNFCCDEDLTKDFEVSMGTKSQVYVWSFEQREWLTKPSQNNGENDTEGTSGEKAASP